MKYFILYLSFAVFTIFCDIECFFAVFLILQILTVYIFICYYFLRFFYNFTILCLEDSGIYKINHIYNFII